MCIKFEREINSMRTFTRAWIDDYSGGKLVSLKGHCNGKPRMKDLSSFKASVLKMPAAFGQKEVDMSVSPDKVKLPLHIFLQKMISFRMFPNLEDLVTREENLNFEKDSGSLYVNKDGYLEFVSAHGDMSVIDLAEDVLKSNFFSILMNRSTIHMREKRVYTFSRFKKKNS